MSEVQPNSTISREFSAPAGGGPRGGTAAALEANGITVLRAPSSAEAKRMVLDLIPRGRKCIKARRPRSRLRASPRR
jgi:hypothetical protein